MVRWKETYRRCDGRSRHGYECKQRLCVIYGCIIHGSSFFASTTERTTGRMPIPTTRKGVRKRMVILSRFLLILLSILLLLMLSSRQLNRLYIQSDGSKHRTITLRCLFLLALSILFLLCPTTEILMLKKFSDSSHTDTCLSKFIVVYNMISDQILLILIGVVGSGKSTVANELEAEHGYVRCNQDEMQGNRHLVEQKVYEALRNGKSVVVDRTNFDSSQRSKFLDISSGFPHVQKWALFLDIPKDVCRKRLLIRTNHPTLEPEKAIMVLNRFSKDLRPPAVSEGFHRVYRLTESPAAGTLGQVLLSIQEKGLVGSGIASHRGNRQQYSAAGYVNGPREHGVNYGRRADEQTRGSSDQPTSLWRCSPWGSGNER